MYQQERQIAIEAIKALKDLDINLATASYINYELKKVSNYVKLIEGEELRGYVKCPHRDYGIECIKSLPYYEDVKAIVLEDLDTSTHTMLNYKI